MYKIFALDRDGRPKNVQDYLDSQKAIVLTGIWKMRESWRRWTFGSSFLIVLTASLIWSEFIDTMGISEWLPMKSIICWSLVL